MVDSTLDSGQWLSLPDAARALGVSEKTARRRVKAGQIEGRQVSTQHGQAWQVWVDGRVDTVARVDSLGTQPSTGAQPPDVAALVALVDRLTVENRQLAEAATVWQERARVLAEHLALAAPPQPQAPSGEPDPQTPPSEPAPRPEPFPWPIPPHPNWRAGRPWLLTMLAIGAVVVAVVLVLPR